MTTHTANHDLYSIHVELQYVAYRFRRVFLGGSRFGGIFIINIVPLQLMVSVMQLLAPVADLARLRGLYVPY